MKSLSFSRSHYLFRNWTVNRLSVPGIHYLLRQLWIHFLLHDFTFYFAKILFTFYFTDSLFYFASISQIYHQSTIYLASLPWIHYIFREFTMNIASILRINFETNLLWIYYEFYYEFCWCFAYILLIHYLSHDSLWIRFAYREYTLILLWIHLVFCEFTIVDFMGKGFYKPRPEKIRLPGSPPSADSLSLLIPDWPIFWIVNFVDLYCPIRIERERELAVEDEPGNLILSGLGS